MEYKEYSYDFKDITEEGVFTAYASTFGGEPDSYDDIIEKGAFSKTLSKGGRNKNGIMMLWGHDHTKVLGVWPEIKEDSKGLYVKGQIALKTQLGSETYELLKIGAVKGLSIGYSVIDSKIIRDAKGNFLQRVLKEIDLWEVSLVTFPANLNAQVTGVKNSNVLDCKTERELEKNLRDAGYSKKEAQYIISLSKKDLRDVCHSRSELIGILDGLKEYNRKWR